MEIDVKRWILPGTICILLIYALYWFFAPAVVRYRLTVEVEDNGKIISGSSVHQASLAENIGPGGRWTATFRGEAVVVDVGSRGVLVAILQHARSVDPKIWNAEFGEKSPPGWQLESLPRVIFERAGLIPARAQLPPDSDMVQWRALAKLKNAKVELLPEEYPYLVSFQDTNDPKTAFRVDYRNLEQAFGPEVQLKRITIETTNESVKFTIKERLPWLRTKHEMSKMKLTDHNFISGEWINR